MIVVEVRYAEPAAVPVVTKAGVNVQRTQFVGPFARAVDVDRWVADLLERWSQSRRGDQPVVVRHEVEDAQRVLLGVSRSPHWSESASPLALGDYSW